jgi:hypothetical protein
MRKSLPLFIIWTVLLSAGPALPQSHIDAGAWTEFYGYEVPNQDKAQIRSLQGLRFKATDVFKPGLTFFFRGRVASDLERKFATDPDFRVFGAYLEYSRKSLLVVRAGRQYVSTGLAGLTLDGGRVDFSVKDAVKLTGFVGAVPGPSFYDFEKIGKWDNKSAYGGRLEYSGMRQFRPAITFMQRNANDNVDSRVGGIDLALNMGPHKENVRLDYDFLFKRVKTTVARSSIKFQTGHRLDLEYLYRRPTFEFSNVFSVFRSEPFHQLRAAPVYRFNKNLFAQGSLSYTIYEDDFNTRFTAGLTYRGQSAGLVFSNGFGGTRLGAYGSLFRDVGKELRIYLNASMFNYKLNTEEDDTTPSVATALGGTCDFLGAFNGRAEIQLLSNRDFEYDTRFYFRLGYNFSSRPNTGAHGGGNQL